MKTDHALDWGKTAQEIADESEAGMSERDRDRKALEEVIANETAYNRGDALSAYIAKTALGIPT